MGEGLRLQTEGYLGPILTAGVLHYTDLLPRMQHSSHWTALHSTFHLNLGICGSDWAFGNHITLVI